MNWTRVGNCMMASALIGQLALGCGDDGGDGLDGADGGHTRDGGGPGPGPGPGGDDCLGESERDELLAPVDLSDGSVIYRMAIDGDDLYFASLDSLFRIPLAGGEHEQLWTDELAISVPFFVREDDVLIVRGERVLSVPKAGGDATELGMLPDRPSGSLDGRVDFIIDGTTAYMKSESGGLGSDPAEVTFHAVDLDTFEATTLATTEIGDGRPIAKSGDGLFVAGPDPSVPAADPSGVGPRPALLYRIPTAGGEPTEVEVDFGSEFRFGYNVAGADPGAVFISALALSDNDDDALDALAQNGLYRVPRAGGEAAQLIEVTAIFNSGVEHDLLGDQNFLRVITTRDEVFSVPVGSTTATHRFCISGTQVHAMAVADDAVYLALYDDARDFSSIVRVDL
jgi:hypothetical protein